MHQNTLIARQGIARGERFADPRFGDIHGRSHLRRAGFQHPATGASRNKFRRTERRSLTDTFVPRCREQAQYG